MQTMFRSLRLPAVGCVLLAGGWLLGCSSGSTSSSTDTPVALTTTVADPGETTSADLSTATVKPADPTAGVMTMTAPILMPSDGAGLASAGTETALEVDPGNTGTAAGTLPLTAQADGTVRGGTATAVLPEGDSAIALSPNTEFDLSDQPLVGALTRGHVAPVRLRVAYVRVMFSVRRKPCAWTLPTSYRLDVVRVKNMYELKNSYLTLYWKGNHFTPPADGAAKLTVDLYNGMTKVAGPLVKSVPVVKDTATFTGSNTVPFNRVGITLDLRDKK